MEADDKIDEVGRNIDEARKKIDEIDGDMVRLLNERAELALKIRRLKEAGNMPIFDARREEEVLQRVESASSGPLSTQGLREIYHKILEWMKSFD